MSRIAARGPLRSRLAAVGAMAALIATLLVAAPPAAFGALSQLGPIDSTGFPNWVDDGAGTRLQLCVDASPPCFTTRPDLGVAPSAENLPTDGEAFFYDAEADIDRGGPLTFMRLAFEAAYEGGQPGTPATAHALFGRVRFRIFGLIPGASYTITYPYGVITIAADAAGRINDTTDIGCLPGDTCRTVADFSPALSSGISNFLQWDPAVGPPAPAGYIGSMGTPHPVIGSPNGTNFFRIDGPAIGGPGVNRVQTNLFDLQGKLAFSTPGLPRTLTAAPGPGNGQIALSWSAPADNGGTPVTGYRVYRGSASGALTAITPDLAAGTTTFTDSGLGNASTRFYAISALNRVGEGLRTAEVSATTFATASAPRSLTATAGPGAGQITLNWTAPASTGGGAITNYRVYRGTTSGALTAVTPDVAGTSTSFVDSGIANGQSRFYAVTAINSVGESLRSNEGNATTFDVASSPRSLAAASGPGRGQINLSWSAPLNTGGTPITGYRVYRGNASGLLSAVADTTGSATTFTDSALGDNTTRFYAVSAINVAGEGLRSNEASATTFRIASAPQLPAANAGPGAGQITLSWNPPASTGGAPITGYRVYRGTVSGALTAVAPDLAGTTTSFVDSGIPENTTVFYAVTALNAVGESVKSAETSAVTFARPGAPLGVAAAAGGGPGQITVSWTAPTNDGRTAVTGYRIYRGTATGALAPLADVTGAARSFTDSGVPEGATRFYAVTAINSVGEGVRSAESSASTFTRPVAPAGIGATGGPNPGQISVSWAAPTADGGSAVSAYRVYRGSVSGALTAIGDVAATARTFTDSGLPEGATRFYAVSAINAVGESTRSAEVNSSTFSRPGVPSALSAATGPNVGQITLNWSVPTTDGGAAIGAYRVYRGSVSGSLSAIADVPGTSRSFIDSGLPEGATRFYALSAINAVGEGARSAEVNAGTVARPSAPPSLAAAAGPNAGEISVSWTAPASNGGSPITGYRVYGGSSAGTLVALIDLPATASAFTERNLAENTTRIYAVTAINSVGESARSATATATTFARPSAPAGLAAGAGPNPGQITLTWSAPASTGGNPITEYRVVRGTTSGALTEVGRVPATTLRFTDSGIPENTTMFYAVSAVNGVGEGPRSGVASATTFARPAAPASVTVTPGPGIGELSLAWGAPTSNGGSPVTAFRVFRGTASGALVALTPDLPATARSFTDAGLPEGASRVYQVASVNAVGVGTPSPEVLATTFARPTAPMSFTATRGTQAGQIVLAWTAPASDGGRPVSIYRVYRGTASGALLPLADLPASARGFTDTGLPAAATRFYAVTAQNTVGESPRSAEASATTLSPPSPPRDVTAAPQTGINLATVRWKPPLDNGGRPITAYRVYRAGSDNVFRLRAEVPATQNLYSDSGLTLLDPFRYRVTAVNELGESQPSNIACTRSYPGAILLGAC